jgi:hypothetical protein
MDEERLAQVTGLTKNAMLLSTRAIASLVSKARHDPETLRASLDLMLQTRALAHEDPIAEHLAVTLIRAAIDKARADGESAG